MSPARKNSDNLPNIVKIGAVVLVVCLGLYGCARKPAARVDNTTLEAKVAKLEQDLRTSNNARDKSRKEVAALESEVARLQMEANEKVALAQEKIKTIQAERDEMHKLLVARTNERDDLRQQVSQRIVERDTLTGRVDKLRKGMQQLMAQDDYPAGNVPGTPTSPSIPTAVSAAPSLGGNS